MKNIKVIIIAVVVLITGLFFLYAVAFTSMFGSPMIAGDQQNMEDLNGSTFKGFKMDVPKEIHKEIDSKTEAYDSELQRKLAEKEATKQDSLARVSRSLLDKPRETDLSKYMTKEEKPEFKQQTSPKQDELPKVSTRNVAPQKSKSRLTPTAIEKENVLTQEATKRRRREDPSFGEEVVKEVTNDKYSDVKISESAMAVVHGDQNIQDRGSIQLRLIEPYTLSDCIISVNTIMTGYCTFDMEQGRILINIRSVKCDGQPHSVNLTVYSNSDGIEGVPSDRLNTAQEVNKEVLNESISEVSRKLNIPIVGRGVTSGANKQVNNPKVQFTSGIKVLVKQKER